MFTCIFCLNEFSDNLKTQEHIVPYSLGGNVSIYEVCQKCNSHLGAFIDEPLVNNFLVDLKRKNLKIRGKNGDIPNPFFYMKAKEDSRKYNWHFKDGKPTHIYTVPHKEIIEERNGRLRLNIVVDASEPEKADEIVKKVLKRQNKKGITLELTDQKRIHRTQEAPEMELTAEISIFRFKLGMLKIAYEIAYKWLGEIYLNDPIAKIIREFLLQEDIELEDFNKLEIKGFIDFSSMKKLENVVIGLDNPNYIYVSLMPIDDFIFCEIKIFDIFYGSFEISKENHGKNQSDGIIYTFDPENRQSSELNYFKHIEIFLQNNPDVRKYFEESEDE